MPIYSYQAINESGSTVTGEIEADSTDMANNILAARGYLPSRVVEKGQIVPTPLPEARLLSKKHR